MSSTSHRPIWLWRSLNADYWMFVLWHLIFFQLLALVLRTMLHWFFTRCDSQVSKLQKDYRNLQSLSANLVKMDRDRSNLRTFSSLHILALLFKISSKNRNIISMVSNYILTSWPIWIEIKYLCTIRPPLYGNTGYGVSSPEIQN